MTSKLLDLVLVKHRRWGRRVRFPSERRFSCRNECIWHCKNKVNEISICFCFFQTRIFFTFSSDCCQDLNREVFVKCCFCQVELRLRGRSPKSHTSNLPASTSKCIESIQKFQWIPQAAFYDKGRKSQRTWLRKTTEEEEELLRVVSAPKEISVS